MTDEESLAKAIYESDFPHAPTDAWPMKLSPACTDRYFHLARAAIAHLQPKPPEPKDEWREAIAGVVERRRDFALQVRFVDQVLAAIAPLREALEKKHADELKSLNNPGYVVAAEWRDKYEAEKKISAQFAKSAGEWNGLADKNFRRYIRLRNAIQSVVNEADTGGSDVAPQ